MGSLDGIEEREPVFGLDARWITPEQVKEAEDKGYRVVDHAALIQTHLAHVIEQNAGEMITVKSLSRPIAELRYSHPQLVDEVLGAGGLPIDTLLKILSNLLKDHVSMGDLRTIFETLAANIRGTCQAEALTIEVRNALQCPAVAEDRAMGNLR